MTVDTRVVGAVGRGILALIGVERGDGPEQAQRLLERVLTYRVFEDPAGRMNLSLRDVGGGKTAFELVGRDDDLHGKRI